jgi:hypothetical protein
VLDRALIRFVGVGFGAVKGDNRWMEKVDKVSQKGYYYCYYRLKNRLDCWLKMMSQKGCC